MTKRRLLIVAHAPSPNTRRLFDAVVEEARSDENQNVEVVALSPFDAGPEDVLAAGAIILGTTENLGYMSGALKDFFDRSYYPCLEKTQGLPYCLYVRAGQDGTGTRRGVETIARIRREHFARSAVTVEQRGFRAYPVVTHTHYM